MTPYYDEDGIRLRGEPKLNPAYAVEMTDRERDALMQDLLANGERVEWCETHGHSAFDGAEKCEFAGRVKAIHDTKEATESSCRIVSRLLVDYPQRGREGATSHESS